MRSDKNNTDIITLFKFIRDTGIVPRSMVKSYDITKCAIFKNKVILMLFLMSSVINMVGKAIIKK
jgi:hypothetical protein